MKRKTVLDAIATSMVGDGKSPNLFFVSDDKGVIMVTPSFEIAYIYYRSCTKRHFGEIALEDRAHGGVASVEYDESEREYTSMDDSREMGLAK